ncbi:hypothetical protein Tco_0770341 [Tanacetum coccineum]|uniref:Secreted protein n=1 Tax=Tanacetum coccineum TaxID=301880 RepID=A0ABQ4ZC64_9ASTR
MVVVVDVMRRLSRGSGGDGTAVVVALMVATSCDGGEVVAVVLVETNEGDDVVVRWWRDGVDDDGGWRWVGMTMVFVAGGRSLAGISPEMVCGAEKGREEGGSG